MIRVDVDAAAPASMHLDSSGRATTLRIGAAMSAGGARGRHLIEQRLEQVVVVPIDQRTSIGALASASRPRARQIRRR